MEHLTVENVLDKTYNVPEIRQYLPDYDVDAHKRIPRDYLFAIVNKVDGTFFPRVIRELSDRQQSGLAADSNPTLNVQPELLRII